MRIARGKSVLAIVALTALVACGERQPQLLNIRSSDAGPDEFQILPTKPLQQPESFTDLPEPTPGGANLTDPTPRADAIEVLGGKRERVNASGLYAGEQGVVAHAARYGVAGDIRQALAAEDLEFRRRNNGRLLERLFNVNVYFNAYEGMSLDQYVELERLRRLGIWTPSAPPDPAG